MDFIAVERANGANADMFGVITEFVGEGINPKSQKPWKKAKIADDTGKVHTVTLRGTLPTVAVIGQRAQFSLSTFQGTFQGQPYTGYSGFWNDRPQVAQQQAPPQEPKSENKPTGSVDIRLNVTCAILRTGVEPKTPDIDYWVEYITTGKVPPPPARRLEPENQDFPEEP